MIRMFLFAAGFLMITIGLLMFQPGSNRGPDPVFEEPVTRAEPTITKTDPTSDDMASDADAVPVPRIVRSAPVGNLDDQSLRQMTWGTLSNLNQATGRESAPGAPGSLLHTIIKRSLEEGPAAPGRVAQQASPDGLQTYIVQEGDSLVSIADAIYGDVNMTGPLFVANQSFLNRPDDLKPGQTLVLPAP